MSCQKPCAPVCELVPVRVEAEPELEHHRHCDTTTARCPRYRCTCGDMIRNPACDAVAHHWSR